MTKFLESLGIAGYRSFGPTPQRLEKLNKITLLIGRNNSGKSNVIRFLSEIYPSFAKRNPINLDYLNAHIPGRPAVSLGTIVKSGLDSHNNPILPLTHPILSHIQHSEIQLECAKVLGSILESKREDDKTNEPWFFISHPSENSIEQAWHRAFRKIDNATLHRV